MQHAVLHNCGRIRQTEVQVGVAYGSDLQAALAESAAYLTVKPWVAAAAARARLPPHFFARALVWSRARQHDDHASFSHSSAPQVCRTAPVMQGAICLSRDA
jgi:hypothetical protein